MRRWMAREPPIPLPDRHHRLRPRGIVGPGGGGVWIHHEPSRTAGATLTRPFVHMTEFHPHSAAGGLAVR